MFHGRGRADGVHLARNLSTSVPWYEKPAASFPVGTGAVCEPEGLPVKIRSSSVLSRPERHWMQFLALKVKCGNESRCFGAA